MKRKKEKREKGRKEERKERKERKRKEGRFKGTKKRKKKKLIRNGKTKETLQRSTLQEFSMSEGTVVTGISRCWV